ncbi:aldolase/citrate lyase family protein [uncultured Clostridium sp.]|uniref:HpcH/HpaI aldolase/citrate lyase family protein n=1 Tax=uncultured Clostridium sp. TaxID=59620 RepID=UPI0028E7B6F9|nr:aldolase/citrate lyase family protein [uncultured Clostridium sp.]
MKKLRRTMLFMPGNNPGMLQNAPILGADAVILDLEDAVSLTEKDAARALVSGAIKNIDYSQVELVVRINPLDTEFGPTDLETIARVKPDTILVPKATKEQMQQANEVITKVEEEEGFEKGSIKLFGLIETAYGLETVYDVATSTDRLVGLLLGAEDLTSDFGIKRTKESDEIYYARCRFAAACRAARVDAIDTPFTDTNDYEGLRLDTMKAKKIGFTGKASINPRQVETIHSVYNPTENEIKYAIRVLEARDEAFAKGIGVFSLDGKMIDAPVINRAITTVDLAKNLGLIK